MKKIYWIILALLIVVVAGFVLATKVFAGHGGGPPPPVKVTCYKENPGIDCMEKEYNNNCPGGWILGNCPTPVDCEYHYGECSVLCGGGTQAVIVDKVAEHLGKSCPVTGPVCNEQACGDGGDDDTPVTPVETVRVETPLTEAGAPVCSDVAPAKIPNIFVTNAGVGKLEVRWIPTGGDKAHIFYGEVVGKPTYSLIDTANDGTEIIGSLNSGTHYWFSLVQGNGCAWSSLSDWYDPLVE